MDNMENYPNALLAAYRDGNIDRQQFITDFRNWQKNHGINFDCKGSADRNGTYLKYRGIKAEIKNGVLCWKNNTAKNLFEFERQVDYAFNQEVNAFENSCYYAGEFYEANPHGDTDRRGEMQQKQNYFLQQAKKWAALWN